MILNKLLFTVILFHKFSAITLTHTLGLINKTKQIFNSFTLDKENLHFTTRKIAPLRNPLKALNDFMLPN